MKLQYHDENLYNFWGGIYEVLPPTDDDEWPTSEVAALCDRPDAEQLAHLFCASPQLLSSAKLALDALEYMTERVGDLNAPGVNIAIMGLRGAIQAAEGGQDEHGS